MRTIRISTISLVTVILSLSAFGQDNDASNITTADDAQARAMLYTGFDKQKILAKGALSVTANLTVIQEDNTPFLSDSIIGKSVWKVVVEGVRFDLPDWQLVDQQPTRTFEVLIDSATGRCFGAYSYFDGHDPDLAPEPPADTITKLWSGSNEKFVGFPAEPPPISLSKAINMAIGSNPVRAKELYCICVMWTYRGEEAIPIWSIIGRGIPPFDWGRGKEKRPLYTRNRKRTIVDATTGNPLRVDNQPPVMIRPRN